MIFLELLSLATEPKEMTDQTFSAISQSKKNITKKKLFVHLRPTAGVDVFEPHPAFMTCLPHRLSNIIFGKISVPGH